MDMSKEEQKTVWGHFPKISKEIIEYATNEVLKSSRYIFVTTGTLKKGYCTHCHARFYVKEPVKQNASCVCPKCESVCIYKKAWVGRKYMSDYGSFLWFEKSATNPKVVIASWIHCSRKYSESYENVQTECNRSTLYVFEMGGSSMYGVWGWRSEDQLKKHESVFHGNGDTVAIESLVEAVRGTPFEYCGWEKYLTIHYLKYLALYSVMPNVETLSKNGFKQIVEAKMENRPLYRSVNWKASKLHDFFKVTKHDFLMMKETDATGSYTMHAPYFPLGLWLWQQARKEKSQMSYKEIVTACSTFNLSREYGRFIKIKKHSRLHRLFNYMQKQFEIDHKHYVTPSEIIITWADYLNDCKTLELDLKNDEILYPKSLRKAHQRAIKLVEVKNDELANLKITKRHKELEPLSFEFEGLIIRPPETFQEIIDEGKTLDHCVSRYADNHAAGKCNLMFIRKKNQPDKPFYTVELRTNKKEVAQVRGKKNKSQTKDVERFMELYKTEVLEKPKSKVRKRA